MKRVFLCGNKLTFCKDEWIFYQMLDTILIKFQEFANLFKASNLEKHNFKTIALKNVNFRAKKLTIFAELQLLLFN